MSRYQFLKENEDILLQFIKEGIISLNIIRDMEIYETFKSYKKQIQFKDRYIELANEFELSPNRIEQIILGMSK